MTTQEIYDQMLAEFETRTGFAMADDADLAVRLHAAAAQLGGLYTYADWALRQAFPQTADGAYLDHHGALRDLTRRAAAAASGTIRFSLPAARTVDIPIDAGTVCTTAGLVRFETTRAGVIAAGAAYTDLPAQAQTPGAAGNVGAGMIVCLPLAPVGVAACTNPAAFSGGADAEDDDSFRSRVLDSFRRLPNGANAAFYETRVLETQGVGAVRVLPRQNGVGTVGVVVTAPAGLPGPELLAAISQDLNQVREIAVDVTVQAPQPVTVPVTAALTVAQGYDAETVLAAAQDAVTAWFDGSLLACPVYRAKLGSLLYALPGVENYTLTAPAADVAISQTQLPVLGTLQITEAV